MSLHGRGCVKTQKNSDCKNIDRPERAVFNFSGAGNGQTTLKNEWSARFDTASAAYSLPSPRTRPEASGGCRQLHPGPFRRCSTLRMPAAAVGNVLDAAYRNLNRTRRPSRMLVTACQRAHVMMFAFLGDELIRKAACHAPAAREAVASPCPEFSLLASTPEP